MGPGPLDLGRAHWHCPLALPELVACAAPVLSAASSLISATLLGYRCKQERPLDLGNKRQRTAPEVGRQPNWLGGCLETSRVRDLSCGTALIKPKNQLRNLHRFHRSNAVPTQPRQPMNMTCAADRCFTQRESWFAAVSLDFSGQVKPWRRTNPVRQKTRSVTKLELFAVGSCGARDRLSLLNFSPRNTQASILRLLVCLWSPGLI